MQHLCALLHCRADWLNMALDHNANPRLRSGSLPIFNHFHCPKSYTSVKFYKWNPNTVNSGPGSNSIVTEFFWSLRLSTKRQRIFHLKSVHNLLTPNSMHSTDTNWCTGRGRYTTVGMLCSVYCWLRCGDVVHGQVLCYACVMSKCWYVSASIMGQCGKFLVKWKWQMISTTQHFSLAFVTCRCVPIC